MKLSESGNRRVELSENAIRILHVLQMRKTAARVDIAEACNLSATTVTSVTAALLEQGFILELESTEEGRGRGRPRVLLGIRPEALSFAGIKVSPDAITVSITSFTGHRIAECSNRIAARRYRSEELVELLKSHLYELLARSNMSIDGISGLGIGIPGYVNHRTGVVNWSPVIFEEEINFQQQLESQIDCPVSVDNDANAATLGERWFGLGAGVNNFIVVTVEHGVGMGAVVNGELLRGRSGYAGEFGHTKIVPNGALCRCGRRGCLEAYVADFAIVKEARTIRPDHFRSKDTSLTTQLEGIADQARAGDTAYMQIFKHAGNMLGIGIANLVNVLCPAKIILSGSRYAACQCLG